MNIFVKPKVATPAPAFVGADAIKAGELTFAREDVARLKSHCDEAGREIAAVTAKLTRVRAYERQLLAELNAQEAKVTTITPMLKAKQRMLFDLEQDGGS